MLYISRRIDTDYYGVVDTDDGKEGSHSKHNLVYAVDACGLTIHGVTKLANGYLYEPYQPEHEITQLQAKTKLVKGVEVTVYKDYITKIRTCSDGAKSPIRLSDFGTKTGDCVLDYGGIQSLVIQLDDSIEVSNAFLEVTNQRVKTVDIPGVVIDVTGVSISHILESIYRQVFSRLINVEEQKSVWRSYSSEMERDIDVRMHVREAVMRMLGIRVFDCIRDSDVRKNRMLRYVMEAGGF